MEDLNRREVFCIYHIQKKSIIDRNYIKYLKFKRKILYIIYTEIIKLREVLYIVHTDSTKPRGGLVSCDVYKIIPSRNLLSFFSG